MAHNHSNYTSIIKRNLKHKNQNTAVFYDICCITTKINGLVFLPPCISDGPKQVGAANIVHNWLVDTTCMKAFSTRSENTSWKCQHYVIHEYIYNVADSCRHYGIVDNLCIICFVIHNTLLLEHFQQICKYDHKRKTCKVCGRKFQTFMSTIAKSVGVTSKLFSAQMLDP